MVHSPVRLGHKLDSLQILRAVAALSVVVGHALHETEALGVRTQRAPILAPGWNLAFGVDIFFVLSGFIMMHTSAKDFAAQGASLRFFLRRCARVVPLYWLLTSLLLVGAMFAPSLLNVPIKDGWHIVASYLFLPDARAPGEVRPVMALGWTLNYEMLFYVLFSLALLTRQAFGIVWLSALMVLLALAHRHIDAADVPLAFWTDPLILEFLFGVYAALIYRSGLRVGAIAALALLAVGCLGFLRFPALWDDAAAPQFLRSGVPAAAMVLAAALGPTPPLGRLAAWGVALGDASYSLYLAHPFVLRPQRVLWERFVGGHLPMALFVVCAGLGSVLFALALQRFAERPLTAMAQRLVEREPTQRASAARIQQAMRAA